MHVSQVGFPFYKTVQIGYAAHLAPYSMGTASSSQE